MKTLGPPSGTTWFVDIAILPFLRRVELRDGRLPPLLITLLISMTALLVSLSGRIHAFSTVWISVPAMAVALISAMICMIILYKIPLSGKERRIYHSLKDRGIRGDDEGLEVAGQLPEKQTIRWDDIMGWYVKILESSANTEVIVLNLRGKGEVTLPFLNLTRSDRMPIPGILEDGDVYYYCYQPNSRVPFSAVNNDFYHFMLERCGDRQLDKRLERLTFRCPHCNDSFHIRVSEWQRARKNILYCDRCPRCVSVSIDDPRYRELLKREGTEAIDTIVRQDGSTVTFRGMSGVEPAEYTFELIKGPATDLQRNDRRNDRFKQALEANVSPCSCGGRFLFPALPRCPLCSVPLPELVEGLGFGRYAILTEELTGDQTWQSPPDTAH